MRRQGESGGKVQGRRYVSHEETCHIRSTQQPTGDVIHFSSSFDNFRTSCLSKSTVVSAASHFFFLSEPSLPPLLETRKRIVCAVRRELKSFFKNARFFFFPVFLKCSLFLVVFEHVQYEENIHTHFFFPPFKAQS